jgi:glutaminase
MTEAELEFLDSLLTEKHYTTGEIICKEGEPADLVYFLVSGKVSAWISVDGRPRTWLGGSSQGGIFGESALLGNKVRSADVAADTEVVLQELVAEELLNSENPLAQSVLQKLYRNLSTLYDRKLRRATAQIRTLSR